MDRDRERSPHRGTKRILIYNGSILTLRQHAIHKWNWLVADVGGAGLIRDLGNGEPPADLLTELRDDERLNLQGRVVLPGLIDSHIHVYSVGKHRSAVDLEGCSSIEELQRRTRSHIEKTNALDKSASVSTFLEGHHWDQIAMGREPTKDDLDACTGDQPAIFYRRCWHACVVNSAALSICQISASTPDVDGGVVVRDSTKNPTGVLREKAMDALLKPLTEKEEDFEKQKETLVAGLQECVSRGVTAVQTNDSKLIGNISRAWDAYRELADEGKLSCRVFLTVSWDVVGTAAAPAAKTSHPAGLLFCDRAKLWTDGGLGASTAAMLEPYSDDKENCGVLQMSPEEIDEAIVKVKEKGFRIEAHAIGDRAATHLVESFSKHLKPEDRPILTHCQILNEKLIQQMADNGVVANVQPQFVPSDLPIVRGRLGEGTERLRLAYPWKTLLQSGVHLAGGSDAPVEVPAPLVGMADAMDHLLHPHERLTFAEALEMYTVGAAYAADAESTLGRLEKGMLADFVVLSLTGSSISLSSGDLRSTEIQSVYVQGICRYQQDANAFSGIRKTTPAGVNFAGKSGLMCSWRRGRCACCPFVWQKC